MTWNIIFPSEVGDKRTVQRDCHLPQAELSRLGVSVSSKFHIVARILWSRRKTRVIFLFFSTGIWQSRHRPEAVTMYIQ